MTKYINSKDNAASEETVKAPELLKNRHLQ
jgi:hypothetical protein